MELCMDTNKGRAETDKGKSDGRCMVNRLIYGERRGPAMLLATVYNNKREPDKRKKETIIQIQRTNSEEKEMMHRQQTLKSARIRQTSGG